MGHDELLPSEKEVFAGILSAGGSGADLLLETLCNGYESSGFINEGGMDSFIPDDMAV